MSYVRTEIKKARFFDRVIVDAANRSHVKALGKFGAYVRSDARQSMKPAKRISKRVAKTMKDDDLIIIRKRSKKTGKVRESRIAKAGSPQGTAPRVIQGHIKRFLFFQLAADDKNVIIGPMLLPQKKATKQSVPAMHEQRELWHARVVRRTNRGLVKQHYPQRPFMVPAFNKNINKVPEIYAGTFKRR